MEATVLVGDVVLCGGGQIDLVRATRTLNS